MPYQFSTLSSKQFESLCADLIGLEIGVRFEEFGEGPDGGIDGRYAEGSASTILQAKNYERSGFAQLKRVVRSERKAIDRLSPSRYVFSTSVSMTPTRKKELMEIIGPSLREPKDLYGKEDIEALLRRFPEVLEAHPSLWETNATVLRTVVTEALDARDRRMQPPEVLKALLPTKATDTEIEIEIARDVLFLLGNRPSDDDFILWLGPKLEAQGYRVFSELLTLEPGERWRKEVYRALEHSAAKVLVPASSATQQDDAVMDLIDKAGEVAEAIGDSRFVVPLRTEKGCRINGLRDSVPVDFVRGWGEGLERLLDTLGRQKVPRQNDNVLIAPQWEAFRRRGAVALVQEPEPLVSNWLPIVEMPDEIHYYEVSGTFREHALKRRIARLSYPAVMHGQGLISFADPKDVEESFEGVVALRLRFSSPLLDFVEKGVSDIGLGDREASNMMTHLMRDAWEKLCRKRGMIAYDYSNTQGFHVSSDQAANGFRVPWGRQGGGRRSSMLRNVARKHIWKYGVTALPRLWPFWHFRLKARVLFAEDNGTPEGKRIEDPKKMHRLRRSGCKGWRNKQWHGRLLAFLEVMSDKSAFIRVPLAPGHDMLLASEPIVFTSPVSTNLPDVSEADGEEADESTLGRPEIEETDA